jgi:hypothetical protein
MKRFFKTLCVSALLLLAASCASHPNRLDCEKHLKAINAPAPVVPAGTHP